MGAKGNSGNNVRLDILVSELGYSRSLAKELIIKGDVTVNGKIVTSPGASFVRGGSEIVCASPEKVYVSRGGYKLEKALEYFNIDASSLICADIGASTGGFTDCLLRNGAKKVYAIDNGTGQLDKSLQNDERVVNVENVNAKELKADMFPEIIDFVCIDVSFISLTKLAAAVSGIVKAGGTVVCLIKPQFEAGRGNLNKKGIVKDHGVHVIVIESVKESFSGVGLEHKGTVRSPITGADGNVEYLGYFVKLAVVPLAAGCSDNS